MKTLQITTSDALIVSPNIFKKEQVVKLHYKEVSPEAEESKKEEPDDDRIYTKVNIEASFPGGEDAWAKCARRIIESNEFTESDYGTCIVKFIVDKTGKVSDVEATTMKGSKLAEAASNAIMKGPNWTPAQQNGRDVNAYKVIPITLPIDK